VSSGRIGNSTAYVQISLHSETRVKAPLRVVPGERACLGDNPGGGKCREMVFRPGETADRGNRATASSVAAEARLTRLCADRIRTPVPAEQADRQLKRSSSRKRVPQSSSSHSGGPRAGGIRGGRAGSPMWWRIRCTGAAAVMKATMRISVPRCGQVKKGTPRRCAPAASPKGRGRESDARSPWTLRRKASPAPRAVYTASRAGAVTPARRGALGANTPY